MARAPEYEAQQQAPGAITISATPISASVPDSSGFGTALAGAGKSLTDFGATMFKARDEMRDASARANTLTKLAELRTQAESDPDPLSAEQRFAEAARKIEEEEGSKIVDPQRRAAFGLYARGHALTAQRYVHNTALQRSYRDYIGNLGTQESAESEIAIGAGSPVERQAAIDRYRDTLANGVGLRIFTPQQAEARALAFAQRVDRAEIEGAIKDNPVFAQDRLADPQQFPALDPRQRAQYLALAQEAERAADVAAAEAPEKEANRLFRAQKLTREWLEANRESLPDIVYERFDRALQRRAGGAELVPRAGAVPAGAEELRQNFDTGPDADGYRNLLIGAINDPDTARRAALDHYGEQGALDAGRIERVQQLADAAAADDARGRPWANDLRLALIDRLKPGKLQHRGVASDQLDAVAEFNAALDKDPEMARGEAERLAQRIGNEALARSVARERELLPRPRFAAEDMAGSFRELQTIAGRIRDAWEGRRLSRDDYLYETELLKRWFELYRRAERVPRKES